MKLTYAAVMSKGPNNWNASAPDVPGCASSGRDVDEQRRRIGEALQGHLEDWERTRLPFPWPKLQDA